MAKGAARCLCRASARLLRRDDVDALFATLLALGVALVASLLGVAAFVLANFARFVAYLRYKRLPRPAPAGGLLSGLARETLAVVHILLARARPSRSGTDRAAPAHLDGRPVLFVHGYFGAAPDFRALRRAVEARGRPSYAIGLGSLHAPIESSARVLTEHVMRLVERYRERDGLDIVAHSMGGLVVRRALMDHPELAARVKTLVTLGTPHAGTAATRGAVVGANVKQMRRRSPFLAELSPVEQLCPGARVVTVDAELDAIVYPRETCHLPCAEQVSLPGVGHAGLLVHRRAKEAVVRALEERSS